MTHPNPGRFTEPKTTVVALASDPLLRAELGGFLDGLGLALLAELEPADLEDFLHDSDGLDVLVWDVDVNDTLPALNMPLLALVPDPEAATYALRSGATGVLSRDADGERLRTALRALTDGLAVLEPIFLSALELDTDPDTDFGADLEPLTPRERDVLNLLAEGLPNKAIAKRLGVSEHTVKFHLNAVLGKLGARSRTAAVTKAVRAGLLTL